MSSGESSGGSSTVIDGAWLPWLLWTVIACSVSTSPSRDGANDASAPLAITARSDVASVPSWTTTPVSPLKSPSP